MSLFVIDEIEAQIELLDRVARKVWQGQANYTPEFYCELCNEIERLWGKRDALLLDIEAEANGFFEDEIPF